MSAATLPAPPPSGLPRRKRFTRDEVDQMQNAGLFLDQRLELIDGDLIDKMGQNPPHAIAIRLLQACLIRIFGAERTQVQLPIELAASDQMWNLPEPDIAVLKEFKKEDYAQRHPSGNELLLLVEVADKSLRHDCTTKRDLYARAGVH
jgi:Uma2 family endonuclease